MNEELEKQLNAAEKEMIDNEIERLESKLDNLRQIKQWQKE